MNLQYVHRMKNIDGNRDIKDEIINRVNQIDRFWILDAINIFVKNMTEEK